MSSEQRMADRHLREVDGLAAAREMRAVKVAVVADPVWAESQAGQHLLVCLVNLLARLAETVTHIELVVPKVRLVVPTPCGARFEHLGDALLAIGSWIGNPDLTIEECKRISAVDLVLSVGPPPTVPSCVAVLSSIADGWRCWVGQGAHFPQTSSPSASPTPLGPYFAASLLAGEVFKRARGVTRGGPISSIGYSLWTGITGDWQALDAGPDLVGLHLPPFYLVGAGAVGQGVAMILGATPFGEGCVVPIDDDRHDTTNLNRCFLAGACDVGEYKVDAVARYLSGRPIVCPSWRGTIIDYVSKVKPSTQTALARSESASRYDIVVSCVDRGKSRQDIRGIAPALIIGGSTTGLTAKTNVYDDTPDTPCLGCHNPPEKDAERLRDLERVLRGMTSEGQAEYLRAHVDDPGPILEYLANGACGSVGESMLRNVATASPREFSVSFVSMAAAVLLAARLYSRVLFEAADAGRPRMTSIAFLKGTVLDTALAVDAACPRHGRRA